jgi:hypothetical protein
MRIRKHHGALLAAVLTIVIAGVGAPLAASAASAWAIQPTPNPTGVNAALLNAVSCSAATTCMAVGYDEGSSGPIVAMAEVLNGATWTGQPVPEPVGATSAVLNGVSCFSSTVCTAIGNYSDSSGNTLTLAETWNGATWVIQKTPNPSGTTNAVLSGVSCSSSTDCTAVGNYSGSTVTADLAEVWNGTKWVIRKTPNRAGASVNKLLAVSCATVVACTAVGFSLSSSNVDSMLAEAWNGTKWVIQKTPTPMGSTSAVLRGVSCTSSTACTAVGDQLGSSAFLTLVDVWNGTKWVVRKTPNPPVTTIGSLLTGVSCASSTACTAVGYDIGAPSPTVTLAEAWNGMKWVIQPTLNPTGAQQTDMNGVSCVLATACSAVGYANVGSVQSALVEGHS